jgi:hypothetical protein
MSTASLEKQWLDTHNALTGAIQRSSISHAMHKLITNGNELPLEGLADALEKSGYRKLKFFKSGENSLLFETTENQLLRICYTDHNGQRLGNRIKNPAILQPIRSFELAVRDDQKFTISIMPKVRTAGRNWKHVSILRGVLEQCGIAVNDMVLENVGLIDIPKYGVKDLPVLLDAGGASKTHAEFNQFLLEDWVAKDIKDIPDGTPWQKIFDPRIGTGKPTGVVDKITLDDLERSRGENSIIVQTLKHGGYSEHVQHELEALASPTHRKW